MQIPSNLLNCLLHGGNAAGSERLENYKMILEDYSKYMKEMNGIRQELYSNIADHAKDVEKMGSIKNEI